ncbi:MAG: deaminase, partial [Microthrixaceae bacterium]
MGLIHIDLFSTLDGVAQATGGNNETTDPGFTRGGWALPLGDDA